MDGLADLNRCGMDERPKELIDQLVINCVRYVAIIPMFRWRESIRCEQMNE